MASQGPLSPGTCTNGVRWTNASNMAVSDNTYSGVSFTANNQIAQSFAQNYGFSIPTGSTINGITVSVERRSLDGGGTTKDSIVSLLKADGSIGTGNKADTSTFWSGSKVTVTYGSSSDLWGDTWTAEDINDADFGVFFRLLSNFQFSNPGIDYISITVYYTAGSSAVVKTSNGLALASVKTFNGLALASTKTKNGAATV